MTLSIKAHFLIGYLTNSYIKNTFNQVQKTITSYITSK